MTDQAKPRKRRPGGGRKTADPSGEVMQTKQMRWTVAGWAAAKYIGHARVRELTMRDAAQKRKKERKDEST